MSSSHYSRLLGYCNINIKRLLIAKILDVNIAQYSTMTETVVETKQGKLKGVVRDNINGGKYFSFRGIPFAEPPVGPLRFKEPQELKPWSGIRDALEESKKSAQYDIISKEGEGGDDCLYLDVATNSLTDKRAVMVWIHGGGFSKSSNTYKKYGPDYLLKKDIVFVSINYRLGVLGFLNMEHDESAGNQGLKDQIAALKWVRENIEIFGGDPENVTIFGESAGGASVHALCLSPQAKGLFHKAITQSGVISNPWAHTSSNKKRGYDLANALGKECNTALETIEFLRTIPPLDLVTMYENIYKMDSVRLTLELVPTTDNRSSKPVLSQPVQEMKQKGVEVPLLIGYNSHEGILRVLRDTKNFIKQVDNDFASVINQYLKINDAQKLSVIAKAVREYYFGKEQITEAQINELVQCFGDLLFVNNILEAADIQMDKASPTYLYKFSYRPNYAGMKDRFKSTIEGTCHADEMGCLFFAEWRGTIPEGTRDRTAMERMTTMWTNFAKTGNPTPETSDLIPLKWKPLEKNNKNYLEINDNLTCGQNPDSKIWNVWKPLLESLH